MAKGGMHGEGGCAWDMTRYGNTINERAVRILLECKLVWQFISENYMKLKMLNQKKGGASLASPLDPPMLRVQNLSIFDPVYYV